MYHLIHKNTNFRGAAAHQLKPFDFPCLRKAQIWSSNIATYRTVKSSLAVAATGFLGWMLSPHSSPSPCPKVMGTRASLRCMETSKISPFWVPANIISPIQHTERIVRPEKKIKNEIWKVLVLIRSCVSKLGFVNVWRRRFYPSSVTIRLCLGGKLLGGLQFFEFRWRPNKKVFTENSVIFSSFSSILDLYFYSFFSFSKVCCIRGGGGRFFPK